MEKLLFFLLFFLPLIVLPFGISPFETPKIYIAELVLIVFIIAYCWVQNGKEMFEKSYIPVILLGLLGILHIFLSPTDTVWFGNEFRMYGTFLWILLMLFVIVSSKVSLPNYSGWIIFIFLCIQLLVTVFIEGKLDYRGIGTLGEANSLAGYGIFLFSFILYAQMKIELSKKVFLIITSSIVIILIILFSGSRSGSIGLCIILLFYLLQKYRLSFAVIVCTVILGLSLFLPFTSKQLHEDRATIWWTSVAAIREKPLLGWGVGNTEKGLLSGAHTSESILRFEYVDHTHNIFLEMLVQLGLIGGIVFMWIIGKTFYTFYKTKNVLYMSMLFGLLSIMLFNPISVALLIPFWYVVGQGLTER